MDFFVCIGFFIVVWVLGSPVLTLVLWNRIRDLEERVLKLSRVPPPLRPSVPTIERAAYAIPPRVDSLAARINPALSPPNESPSPLTRIVPSATEIAVFEAESTIPPAELEILPHPVDSSPEPIPASVLAAPASVPSTAKTLTESLSKSSLEEILAGKWLAYVGALAVMIGAGFGLKYAIDNQWLGPAGRVVVGVVAGLISFAGGAYAMRKEYRFLGQALTGAALGILYLSFYAAFDWYHILPYEWAFAGMVLTTAGGLAFAHAFDSQPTAVLGMIGGFLTPAMLPPSTDSIWELFPYLLLLDVGVLFVSSLRRWTGLQVLAFVGTVCTWLVWYHNFFAEELLWPTLGFLTAFFALFAALGVIHNIVRRRVALAADFFLILATPVVYFAALYWLTYEIWPYEQGYFALAMTAVYTIFSILAARLNPVGTSVTAALAGLAGMFLILAPPLSLTGHWVTVTWIAESVLLVELGLRFELKSLTWTGLSLLAKVQCVLIIYAIGTLVDPIDFQTAFVRQTLHLSVPHEALSLAWTDVFNNRSYSYLMDVFGLGLLAWEYRRRREANLADDPYGPSQRDLELWLLSGVPIVGLSLGLLEVFVWGTLHHWHRTTILSACSIWASLVAASVIAWGVRVGPRGVERVAWAIFGLLALFLGFNAAWTIEGVYLPASELADIASPLWLLNPRGFGFLSAVIALVISTATYRFDESSRQSDLEGVGSAQPPPPMPLDQLFGGLAYWLGLSTVLLETYVWGLRHQWQPGTIVSAFSIWAALFAIGLVLWQTDWSHFSPDKRTAAGEDLNELTTPDHGEIAEASTMVLGIFSLLGTLLVLNSVTTVMSVQTALARASTSSDGPWWLLNPRGISFLVACAAAAISAWLVQRDRRSNQSPLCLSLGSASYLAGLTAVLLETLVWGRSHEWRVGTILSFSAIWTSACAAGLIAWRVRWGSRTLDGLVQFVFLLLGGFLLFNSLGTFTHASAQRLTTVPPPDEWWLLNPRGLGFVMAIGAAALAAMLYQSLTIMSAESGQERDSGTSRDAARLGLTFGVVAFLGGLTLVLLETAVWGMPRGWLFGTLISTSAMWTALFASALAIWVASNDQRELDQLVIGVFLLLGGLIVLSGIVPFAEGLNGQTAGADAIEYEWWFLNPRGLGYLLGIAAAGLAAAMYRRLELETPRKTALVGVLTLSQILGVSAYLAGLALVTTEAFAQGTTRQWLTGTSLAVTIAWTMYATGTLVAGIYWRAATVRILALSLLVLTIGKVFLIDIWHLETVIRVFAFMSLGAALMLVSFLYRRYRDRIRAWVVPTTPD